MEKLFKTLLLMMVLSFICGCVKSRSSTENSFAQTEGICLNVGNGTTLTYDPNTWQYSFNYTLKEFRVNTDNMSHYWILRTNRIPTSVEQHLTCTLTFTGTNSIRKYSSLDMEVVKSSTDGRMWLWSAEKKIGVVIVVQ